MLAAGKVCEPAIPTVWLEYAIKKRRLRKVSGQRDQPIEPTFATVRHRTKVTKGPGSRAAGLAMAFKLIESAQDHWRAKRSPTSLPWCASERASSTASSPDDQRGHPARGGGRLNRAEAATAAGSGEHRARQVVTNPFDSDPVARRYARAPTTTTWL
jgi:hypothetical protein